jgi:hypothetical protein
MKVIYLLSLLGLALAGCSSTKQTADSAVCSAYTTPADCTSATFAGTACAWNGTACVTSVTQCTDIKNETLCEGSAFASGGCYWTGTDCAVAADCSKPTTEASCTATSYGVTKCSWGSAGCYLKSTTLACSGFTTKDICQTSSGTDGFCYWDNSGSTCKKATGCANLQDGASCTNAQLASGGTALCKWTPASDTCVANSPALCTLNTDKTACCAGNDTSCQTTNANCDYSASGYIWGASCSVKSTPTCTVNSNTGIASKNNTACCAGTDQTCTTDDANCTYVGTSGSCGE